MFIAYVVPAIVGLICILIGISNMKGNISSLHSYHRSRVSEEDRLPFGKLVGKGMIIIGISVCVMALSMLAVEIFENEIFAIVGMILMGVGFVIGLSLAFYAMKKYNGGIF